MKESELTRATDGVEKRYSDEVTAAQTLALLRAVLTEWAWCTPDALAAATEMEPAEFPVFREGWEKEKRGQFAGEDFAAKWGMILLPEHMIRTTIIADHFTVPWGLAWERYKERRDGSKA